MIYVIIGKSLSGKSYLQAKLNELNIVEPFKTTTTRPKRSPNENGYHFVSNAQAQTDIANGGALAMRTYHVVNGETWVYYINKRDLLKQNRDVSLIIDYQGYLDLKKQIDSEKLQAIYLDIPLKPRLKRYLETDRAKESEHEFVRRLYDDELKAFAGIDNDLSIKHVNSVKDAIKFISKSSPQALKYDQVYDLNTLLIWQNSGYGDYYVDVIKTDTATYYTAVGFNSGREQIIAETGPEGSIPNIKLRYLNGGFDL